MLNRLSLTRLLLLMLLGGFALDFRRIDNTSTSYAQFAFLAVGMLGGLTLCGDRLLASGGRISIASARGRFVFLAIMAFAAWAPVAVLAGTSPNHSDFVSTFLPYALMSLTMLAVTLVVGDGFDPMVVVRTLTVVAVVSSVWRVIYAFAASDASVETIRWQILSPALPILLGSSAALLITSRRVLLPLAGLTLFFAIVLLSVTRAYLLSVLMVMASAVVLALKGGLATAALRRILKPAALFFVAIAFLLIMGSVAGIDAASRWTDRLTSQRTDDGIDVTLITRLAEYKGQYDSLMASPTTMLVGKGFGSSYEWDEGYLTDFLEFIVEEEESTTTKGSHSTWLFPFYTHGLIIGTAFVVALLMSLGSAFRRCRQLSAGTQQHFVMVFSYLCLASYFGISVTANIINDRLGGIMVGALVGLVIAQRRSTTDNRSFVGAHVSRATMVHT